MEQGLTRHQCLGKGRATTSFPFLSSFLISRLLAATACGRFVSGLQCVLRFGVSRSSPPTRGSLPQAPRFPRVLRLWAFLASISHIPKSPKVGFSFHMPLRLVPRPVPVQSPAFSHPHPRGPVLLCDYFTNRARSGLSAPLTPWRPPLSLPGPLLSEARPPPGHFGLAPVPGQAAPECPQAPAACAFAWAPLLPGKPFLTLGRACPSLDGGGQPGPAWASPVWLWWTSGRR